MNKFKALLLLAPCSLLHVSAQQSYMASEDVAVFYPAQYDAAAHSPSPIFIRELAPQGPVSSAWKLRPVFSTEEGKSVVRIKVDADADLYGGGEVWGPLRRNGKTIEFWNVDTPCYGVDDGTHLYQGNSSYSSDILLTYRGGKIYNGRSTYDSDVVATWRDGKMYRGRSVYQSDVLFTYKDNKVYRRNEPYQSSILLRTSGNVHPIILFMLLASEL